MMLQITEIPLIQKPPTTKHSAYKMPPREESEIKRKQSAKKFRWNSDKNRACRMLYTVPGSFWSLEWRQVKEQIEVK